MLREYLYAHEVTCTKRYSSLIIYMCESSHFLSHCCYKHFRLYFIIHSFFGSGGLSKCEGTSNDDAINPLMVKCAITSSLDSSTILHSRRTYNRPYICVQHIKSTLCCKQLKEISFETFNDLQQQFKIYT